MHARVSTITKFTYGLGSVAEGLFARGYEILIFFYFVQVLGLKGTYGGLAMLIATLFDAVADPVVGSISDGMRSRFGRRHPFMYASALPVGLSWYLLLSPPDGLGQTGLFFWFLGFSILIRQSLTLFNVPHTAMGAELSHDYHERTSVVTWRIFLSFIGSFGVIVLFTRVFFAETPEFPQNGMLNPAGYPRVALYGGVLMTVAIAWSAWGTRRALAPIPASASRPEPFSLRRMLAEMRIAWQNPSFRALFAGTTLFAISIQINEVVSTFLRVYFWGLTSAQIANLFPPVLLGVLIALPATRLLHLRLDKRWTLVCTSIVPAALGGALVVLRMLGLLPTSSGLVMPLLSAVALLSGICGVAAYISAGSMMADVSQEVTHTSGRQLTGLLFAGASFSQKCAQAGAQFLAGVWLDAIAIPRGAQPSDVDPERILLLGVVSLVALVFSVCGILAYSRYRIDRARHATLSVPAAGTDVQSESGASGRSALVGPAAVSES
jgi:glycoside/pentoside/hexuronide:cation symporter, GPH family